MKSLQKHVPVQFLPKEYGGDKDVTLSNTCWRQYILENADYYENLENNFPSAVEITCDCNKKRKESCV